jgi:hypothetical protein
MAALILNPDELMFEGYMTHTLGIANLAVRNSLRAQGLGTVHDFTSLTEGDIEDICKIIRRPGGTIPNPAFERGGRNALPVPEHLPNPGIQIGHLHEKRLKMLRYYTFYLQRIQRNFDPNVATMQVLQEIYLLKEVDDEDLKPALPEKLMTMSLSQPVSVMILIQDLAFQHTRKK